MSRDDGFAVMDMSTDIVNDPKIRKLFRQAPDCAAAGFTAYVATVAESWKAGERVHIEDAWPAFLPFDRPTVHALEEVGLLDANGVIPLRSWRGWFDLAKKRREESRERWKRYNEKRAEMSTNNRAVPTSLPRGNHADTATSVPPVPPVPPVVPPPPTSGGRRNDGTNPRTNGTAPRDEGVNPRATGDSVRQVRDDQKHGTTKLGDVLRDAIDAEREILRREALALHESFLRGEMTEAVYERRRQDIGKQPDDLTRLESLEAL